MSAKYDQGRAAFLRGEIAWLTDDIKAVLVTSGYTPNFATHEFLSSISAPAQLAMSDNLDGKTVTDGWASAERIEWEGPSNGTAVGVVIIKDTGDAATSPLLAYLNENITNFPLGTNGAKVTFFPDPDTGLFRL